MSNNAVLKTLKILEIVSSHPEGIVLSEIARESGLAKSTVFDILESLYAEDAVFYKDHNRKTYVIGAKVFGIGQAYLSQSNFLSIASPLLDKFSNDNNVIVYGVKRLNNHITYVYSKAPESYILTPKSAGASYPLLKSYIGKLFAAYSDVDVDFLDSLEKKAIVSQGYIAARDQKFASVYKCAVPVFNFENKMVAAIAFTKLLNENENNSKLIEEFKLIARQISIKQGYRLED